MNEKFICTFVIGTHVDLKSNSVNGILIYHGNTYWNIGTRKKNHNFLDTNFFLTMKTQIPEFESFKYLFWNLTYMKRYTSIKLVLTLYNIDPFTQWTLSWGLVVKAKAVGCVAQGSCLHDTTWTRSLLIRIWISKP